MQNVLTMDQLDDMTAQIEATKLSLVTREQGISDYDLVKDRFIAEHQDAWKATGEHYRSLRTGRGITRKSVAEALGVSASKISNFENGQGITHAKLIAKAYGMFLTLHEIRTTITKKEYVQATADVEYDEEEDDDTEFLDQLGLPH